MKSNSAVPKGLLTGKPTWSNSWVFRHVGFFVLGVVGLPSTGETAQTLSVVQEHAGDYLS